jgi:hypothetical protein
MSTIQIPPPEELLARAQACREELAALKKLYRLSEAAAKAEEARRRRQEAERAK